MEELEKKINSKKIADFTYLIKYDNRHAIYNSVSLDLIMVEDVAIVENIYKNGRLHEDQIKGELYSLLKRKEILPWQRFNDVRRVQDMTEKVERQIEVIYVVISWNCNLLCSYCHIHDAHRLLSRSVINKEKLYPMLRKLISENVIKEIVFYGGEPLLYPGAFIEIVSNIRERIGYRQNITLFTNGMLISDKIVQIIKKYNVFPIVSIDGPKEINSLNRYDRHFRGTYSAVENGINKLRKEGLGFGLSLVAANNNYRTLTENVRYLYENFAPVDIGISTLHQKYGSKNERYKIVDISMEITRLFDYLRNNGLYCEHIFRKVRPFIEKKVRINDCPSCGYKVILEPNDRLSYCEGFAGNDRYWCRYDTFSAFEPSYNEWFEINPFRNSICLKCPVISICGGGCPYDAFIYNGSIKAIDPYKCVFATIMFEWLIREIFSMYYIIPKGEGFLVIDTPERKFLSRNIDYHDNKLPLRSYSESTENKVVIE